MGCANNAPVCEIGRHRRPHEASAEPLRVVQKHAGRRVGADSKPRHPAWSGGLSSGDPSALPRQRARARRRQTHLPTTASCTVGRQSLWELGAVRARHARRAARVKHVRPHTTSYTRCSMHATNKHALRRESTKSCAGSVSQGGLTERGEPCISRLRLTISNGSEYSSRRSARPWAATATTACAPQSGQRPDLPTGTAWQAFRCARRGSRQKLLGPHQRGPIGPRHASARL